MSLESIKRIGGSQAGKADRAIDWLTNRPVAIKRIKAEKLRVDAVENVLEEIRMFRRLHHPNLGVVYDAFHDNDLFIITEWFDGENLETLSRHGKMLFEQFVSFALQVQEGMVAAHALNILHRGIKPANILLQWLPSGSMHVKIVDFGLSQLTDLSDQADCARYMSPEHLERQPLDARSDLYSLGCLYYFGLTQRHPFDGEDRNVVVDSHLRHHVAPLHEVRPDLPKWLCDWVMWHIARQPADRPQSAMTALQRFRQQAFN
jgi:serine/threonine protein kinase